MTGLPIMFTPPSDELILDESKTMTARLWIRKPPTIDDVVSANTGRGNNTRFALITINDVFKWNGCGLFPEFYRVVKHGSKKETTVVTQIPEEPDLQVIAEKEGFGNWDDFYMTYFELNRHHWDDEKRTHYFIEFSLHTRWREEQPLFGVTELPLGGK